MGVDCCVILLVEIILLSTVLFQSQMGASAVGCQSVCDHKKYSNMKHLAWVHHDRYSQVAMLSTLTSLALGVFVKFHVLYSRQNVSTPSKYQTFEKKMGSERISVDEINKITNTSRERNTRVIDIRLLPRTISIFAMVLCQARVICGVGGDSPLTKQNCTSKCGDVNVPYPFGFTDDGDDCYRENFYLTCNKTDNPPKTYWGGYQVIDIRLESSQMRVFMALSYICYNGSGGLVWSVPLAGNIKFSSKDNVYIAIGCDTYAYLKGIGMHNYTTGCISICENKESVVEDSCSGMGCCQTSIAPRLQVYNTEFRSDNKHENILDFNQCSYAFLVERNNYTFNISDLTYMGKARSFPIVLDWSIGTQTCENAQSEPDYACVSKNSYCLDSTNGDSYICNCSHGYQGNPYIEGGCQDTDECQFPEIYSCNGTCTNIPGGYNCTCPEGTAGNPRTYGCTAIPKNETSNTRVAILVPVTIVLFVVCAIFIFKRIKQRREVIQRKRYFIENHGLLLQHLLSSGDDNATNTKIFTMKEMMKATNNFDDVRIVGCGGHGVVYKGIMSDLRVVAIKKSKTVLKSEIEEFVNEVALLSQMNHRNIVRLFGCCLESEVPLLVYEFISNGTLADRIHIWDRDQFHFPWEERLRIASEVAGAVAYLHFSTSRSVFHRDLKSANILLDDKLTAKVSDFGASKFVMTDQTHVTTVVQGTFGYLDPEYFQTGKLTDKSDVYSFGVILLELLTGEKPSSISVSREGRSLVTHFIWAVSEKKIFQVIEPLLVNEFTRKELQVVSELAEACLKLRGEDRPTMKEVEVILNGLRKKTKRNQEVVDNETSSL